MRWGYSSAGRAPALHAGGQRFESAYLQAKEELSKSICEEQVGLLGLNLAKKNLENCIDTNTSPRTDTKARAA